MNAVPTLVAPPPEDLRTQLAVLQDREKRWTVQEKKLKDKKARLQQELREKTKLHQDLQVEHARLQQELKDEKEKLEKELKGEKEKLEKELSEKTKLQQELREKTKLHQDLQVERARLQQELKDEKEKLEKELKGEKEKLEKELKDEKEKLEKKLSEKRKLQQELKDEKTKLQQELEERLRLSSAKDTLKEQVEKQEARIEDLQGLLRSFSAGRAMAGGGTPATTSPSNAVAYQRLPDHERLQRVELTSLLRVKELDQPPEDFFPDHVLAGMQDVPETQVQNAMNEQLSKAVQQLDDRWYADTHKKALVGDYKPDAALFTARDVHVADNVLFLLEYKSGDSESITDSDRGQAVSYGFMLLSQCSWRSLAFVVLVNGRRLQVVKVEAGWPRRRATFCIELSFSREEGKASAGLAALWHLLRMPRSQLGAYAALPSGAVPARYRILALGGYSTVFVGELPTSLPIPWPQRFVAKVFARLYPADDGRRPDTCFDPELKSLSKFKQLRDSDDSDDNKRWQRHLQHLPKLIEGRQAPRAEGCVPVPDGGDANAVVPPADAEQPRILYMEYEGEPSSEHCTAASFCGLVLALEVAHKEAKRVHRDIRPPNVTFRKDGQACLIDWGLSAPVGSEESTCICHAFSPIECPCYQAGKQRYGAKDDLCSLVLLYVYMIERKCSGDLPDADAQCKERKDCWQLSETAESLYRRALACDYEGLAKAWSA